MVKLNPLKYATVFLLAAAASISAAGAASGEEPGPELHSSDAKKVTFPSPNTYTWTVPAGVQHITVSLYGAQGYGGSNGVSDQAGGKGGYTQATIPVKPGETFQINVGGQGGFARGGYNGGGGSSLWGGGGGGASDIRTGTFTAPERLLVAGGGGGAGSYKMGSLGGWDNNGGAGAGGGFGVTQRGGNGVGVIDEGGHNFFGEGGSFTCDNKSYGGYGGNYSGGGGSGWCGGGGGTFAGISKYSYLGGGGGGGSGYASPNATNKSFEKGTRSGDGEVTIEY